MRSQLVYKAKRYGTTLIVADRWYPSSKLCSACGWKYKALSLAEREWVCQQCGACHDRDHNAAINLQRLATAAAGKSCGESALPGASSAVTSGTAAGIRPAVDGKVTPVRYDFGQQDDSGQEENRVHAFGHIFESRSTCPTKKRKRKKELKNNKERMPTACMSTTVTKVPVRN
jgi:putative transposase